MTPEITNAITATCTIITTACALWTARQAARQPPTSPDYRLLPNRAPREEREDETPQRRAA